MIQDLFRHPDMKSSLSDESDPICYRPVLVRGSLACYICTEKISIFLDEI